MKNLEIKFNFTNNLLFNYEKIQFYNYRSQIQFYNYSKFLMNYLYFRYAHRDCDWDSKKIMGLGHVPSLMFPGKSRLIVQNG